MMVNLAKHHNWRFAVFSPENSKEQHVGKLVEKITEASLDPKSSKYMSETEFLKGMEWVNNRFFFLIADDDKDLPTLDWIFEKAKMAILQYGIKGLVIDPYNEIEHQMEKGGNETHYISKFISRIKKFAKTHGIKVWIVAHPAKMLKNKDGEIMVPTPYDIAGSANWTNKADNIVIVHRAATDNVTEIHIAKVRNKHAGRKGQINLVYDRVTGRYSVPPAEDYTVDKSKKKAQSKWVNKEDDYEMRTW
jgi:twinkle protein